MRKRGDGEFLMIRFGGWFMCRLPTDPDPTDERRGVSGSTFAYGDEPDLDRIIRLHAPASLVRSHGPKIGVHVTQATFGDRAIDALRGARVDLLDHPRFENRNFVLTMAGKEPISPFHFAIQAEGFELRRKVNIDPTNPEAPVHTLPRMALQKYGARGFYTATDKVLAATGITDPLQSRIERRDQLILDLQSETDELRREVIRRRILELEIPIRDPKNERLVVMRAIEEFTFDLNGRAEVLGTISIAGHIVQDETWPLDFWMGGWDADAMSGYMAGTLKVPFDS